MPVPMTPHREAYQALVNGGMAAVVRKCLAGARIGEHRLEVGEVIAAPPSISEHDARLNGRHWRGWIHAELGLAPASGLPTQRLEPGLNLPLPWMTDAGSFIRHGVELAPIVQLVPRPGAWLRSSLNEAGTRRTAQIDIIASSGGRLRLAKGCDLDGVGAERVIEPVKLIWLTSWQQRPPRDLTALKGLLASTGVAPWVPMLGAEGRDRLNTFVRRAFGAYDATSEHLTIADIEALEACLELALEEPEPNGSGFGPDPADLREMRVLTIADQVRDALAAALAVALALAQFSVDEGQSSQTPSIDVGRTLVADLTALGHAALSQDPARGGVVMEWTSRTRVRAPFADGRLLQALDETNPLAQYSHLHKVTRGGPGGVNSRYGAAEYRELDPTQIGALCPFETPESEHLGLRLHLARGYDIADGVLQSRNSDPLLSDDWLGAAASLVPFLCHNDAARGLMGAKNLKQAVTLVNPEPPLVATGWETDVAVRSGALVRALTDGVVSSVETEPRVGSIDVRIDRPGGRGGIVSDRYVVPSLRPTAAGTIAGLSPRVKVGDAVRAGDVIAAHPAVVGEGLALGVNLRVAYMPFRGLNSEDGIVVSERLVREQVLASRHLVRVRWTVPSSQQLRRGRAEPNGDVRPARLDNRGIVRVGAWVDTGDELARTYPRPNSSAPSRGASVALPRKANAGEFGTVVRAHVRRNLSAGTEIEIWLESTRHLEAGDKLMGRHGNKGVVTAILPEDQMPHIEGVGPVDVVLSPVGMLNRMILGALAETQIGWCLKHTARKDGAGPIRPFTASTKLDSAQLSVWLKNTSHVDHTGRVRVRLGQDGELTDQPVVVGYQYFVKLNHLAQNKVVFRGVGNMNSRSSYGRATLQPVRGRRVRGGQRLGEMESWALAAWGVPALLDEFRGLKSDDVQRRSQFVAALSSSDAPLTDVEERAHVSEAWFGLQTLLVALGFNLQLVLKSDDRSDVRETVMGPLLPGTHRPPLDQVDRIHCEVLDDLALERVVLERRVLASQVAIRLQSISRAPLPLVRTPSARIRRESWIQLACGCEGLADGILDRRQQGGWKCLAHQEPYKRDQVQDTRVDRFGRPGGLYAPEVWGGLDTDVRSRLAYGLIDLGLREAEGPEDSKSASPVGQCLHPITGQTMRYLPVVPPIYREGNLFVERAYSQVVRATRAYCELKNREFDVDRLQESVNDLFEELVTLVGTKDGFVRQRMLGKRVDLSGRAVVVAEPQLGIDECGLPLDVAVGACEIAVRKRAAEVLEKTRLSESEIAIELKDASASLESGLQVQHWLEARHLSFAPVLKRLKCAPGEVLPLLRKMTNEEAVLRLGPSLRGGSQYDHAVTEMLEHGRGSGGGRPLDAWLRERGFDATRLGEDEEVSATFALSQTLQVWCQTLLDRNGVKVLLNRQPTLHRYGLMAFAPRVRLDNVIGLSPTVCAAFNADFDGDTMAIHVPATRQACEQAWSRMRPSVNIFSVAAGQPVLQLSHEARAGLLAGKLAGAREFDDTCAALLDGMQLGDRALAGWSDPTLAMHAIEKGFAWATKAGLSPSWSELTSEDVRGLASELEKDRGAHTELSERLASTPFKGTALSVLALSNALRRPANALIQLCYRRGAFTKLTGGETLPVEHALADGLSPAELVSSCYGARKTLAEKKMLTPKAGELTRLLAWAVGQYRIREGDCQTEVRINVCDLARDGTMVLSGKEWRGGRADSDGVRSPLGCKYLSAGRVCQACYGPLKTSGSVPARNLPVGMLAATSIGERGTQLALRTFHTGGVAGLDTMAGFPRVRALLLGHQVRVSGRAGENAWEAIGSTGLTMADAGGFIALRLGDIRDLQQIARVFMFEMFLNYRTDEIDPRHFEMVLAPLLRFEKSGRLEFRSLLGTARAQDSPFDALAFGYAKQALKRLHTADYELGPTTKIRLLGGLR